MVRAKFKTRPLNQGMVANEVRRRIMTIFAARGIALYVGPAKAQGFEPKG